MRPTFKILANVQRANSDGKLKLQFHCETWWWTDHAVGHFYSAETYKMVRINEEINDIFQGF